MVVYCRRRGQLTYTWDGRFNGKYDRLYSDGRKVYVGSGRVAPLHVN